MPTHRQPTEPEIIPPGQEPAEWGRGRHDTWGTVATDTARATFMCGRVGPVGILLFAMLVGTIAALVFVVAVGAFLVWIPVAVLLFAAAVVGTMMRRYLQR